MGQEPVLPSGERREPRTSIENYFVHPWLRDANLKLPYLSNRIIA